MQAPQLSRVLACVLSLSFTATNGVAMQLYHSGAPVRASGKLPHLRNMESGSRMAPRRPELVRWGKPPCSPRTSSCGRTCPQTHGGWQTLRSQCRWRHRSRPGLRNTTPQRRSSSCGCSYCDPSPCRQTLPAQPQHRSGAPGKVPHPVELLPNDRPCVCHYSRPLSLYSDPMKRWCHWHASRSSSRAHELLLPSCMLSEF